MKKMGALLYLAAGLNLVLCVFYLPGVMLIMATDSGLDCLTGGLALLGVTAPVVPLAASALALATGCPVCLLLSACPLLTLLALLALLNRAVS